MHVVQAVFACHQQDQKLKVADEPRFSTSAREVPDKSPLKYITKYKRAAQTRALSLVLVQYVKHRSFETLWGLSGPYVTGVHFGTLEHLHLIIFDPRREITFGRTKVLLGKG